MPEPPQVALEPLPKTSTALLAMADRFKCPALPRYFRCFDAYIRQGTWCAHATLLFNIDTEDILMTEAEKHQSLAWLSEKLTMAERMRCPSRNKVVRAVQEDRRHQQKRRPRDDIHGPLAVSFGSPSHVEQEANHCKPSTTIAVSLQVHVSQGDVHGGQDEGGDEQRRSSRHREERSA